MIDHVYSDPHFGHKNILKFCDRPYADVREMDRDMIARYNALVMPDETVLWLGDCFWHKPAEAQKIMARLNGKKLLVRGNHDFKTSQCLALGFNLVTEELAFRLGGRMATAIHFPPIGYNTLHDSRYLEMRKHLVKGQVYLHGHTHEHSNGEGYRVHVGVDAWNYAPVSVFELQELLEKRGV